MQDVGVAVVEGYGVDKEEEGGGGERGGEEFADEFEVGLGWGGLAVDEAGCGEV